MKNLTFTPHQLQIIKEFFHPREYQIQLYFSNICGDCSQLVEFFKIMGYEPNKNTRPDDDGNITMYYYDIPERFRNKYITRTETKLTSW